MRAFANLVEVAFRGAPKRTKDPAKFELVEDEAIPVGGVRLRRLRALRNFGVVKADNLGGYVEGLHNLSSAGAAWIRGQAAVSSRTLC